MDSIWTFLTDQLAQNQFLSGGALLAAFGMGFAYLRNVPYHIYNWLRRHLVLRIDILDRDEAFSWMVAWLAQHPYKRRCRLLSVKTSNSKFFKEPANNTSITKDKKQIILSPAPGPHIFFYKRRLVILRRTRLEGGDLAGGMLGVQEKFDLTIFSRNVALVSELIHEAQEIANPISKSVINIYRSDWGEWVFARTQPIRGLETVILANNYKQILLEDLKEFQTSEDWYTKYGVPYRRGYLLHGPPGNGKSSVVTALASELNLNICVLTLSSRSMNDENLMKLCSEAPANSLILIEDIDCTVIKNTKDNNVITFSGLLNALDGIAATEGRIMFMTTNHRDKLDSALIRPGRCDVDMEFNNATKCQAESLFLQFYPGLQEQAKDFSIKEQGSSMAQLQGLLIKGKTNDVN